MRYLKTLAYFLFAAFPLLLTFVASRAFGSAVSQHSRVCQCRCPNYSNLILRFVTPYVCRNKPPTLEQDQTPKLEDGQESSSNNRERVPPVKGNLIKSKPIIHFLGTLKELNNGKTLLFCPFNMWLSYLFFSKSVPAQFEEQFSATGQSKTDFLSSYADIDIIFDKNRDPYFFNGPNVKFQRTSLTISKYKPPHDLKNNEYLLALSTNEILHFHQHLIEIEVKSTVSETLQKYMYSPRPEFIYEDKDKGETWLMISFNNHFNMYLVKSPRSLRIEESFFEFLNDPRFKKRMVSSWAIPKVDLFTTAQRDMTPLETNAINSLLKTKPSSSVLIHGAGIQFNKKGVTLIGWTQYGSSKLQRMPDSRPIEKLTRGLKPAFQLDGPLHVLITDRENQSVMLFGYFEEPSLSPNLRYHNLGPGDTSIEKRNFHALDPTSVFLTFALETINSLKEIHNYVLCPFNMWITDRHLNHKSSKYPTLDFASHIGNNALYSILEDIRLQIPDTESKYSCLGTRCMLEASETNNSPKPYTPATPLKQDEYMLTFYTNRTFHFYEVGKEVELTLGPSKTKHRYILFSEPTYLYEADEMTWLKITFSNGYKMYLFMSPNFEGITEKFLNALYSPTSKRVLNTWAIPKLTVSTSASFKPDASQTTLLKELLTSVDSVNLLHGGEISFLKDGIEIFGWTQFGSQVFHAKASKRVADVPVEGAKTPDFVLKEPFYFLLTDPNNSVFLYFGHILQNKKAK